MRAWVGALALMIGATGLVGGNQPVSAFSQKEIADAAYHWGRVDFAAQNCGRMAINDTVRAEIGQALNKLGKDSWDSGYKLGQTEGREYHDVAGKDAFCELAWTFYGRNGQMVPNLLLRR